jgi:hypothetical protein
MFQDGEPWSSLLVTLGKNPWEGRTLGREGERKGEKGRKEVSPYSSSVFPPFFLSQ